MIAIEEKECKWCKETKPLTEFYTQKRYSKERGEWIYYNPECKSCTYKNSLKWQANNKEKRLASVRKDQLKPERQEYLKMNSKRQKETGYYKNWQRSNPDKISKYREEREMNKAHTISKKEWEICKTYFNDCCAYCGMSDEEHKEMYNQQLHKEHVDHNGANDLSNCVPSCKGCNSSKGTLLLEDWYNSENPKYTIRRYNKINKWLSSDVHKYIVNKVK